MSLLITEAGVAASVRASERGIRYKIAEISIGNQGYTPTPDQTALRNEIQRKALTRGEVVGVGQLHFETVWDGEEAFEGKELGYWLDDGTLFAVDSRNGEVITYKQRDTVVTEACELNLAASTIDNITVELMGTPSATEERAGIAKIAKNEQVNEGEDDTTFITPKKLRSAPKPLVLKQNRLYPENLVMSMVDLVIPPSPEWVLPASASKVKFIEIETRIMTSELINIGMTIYCHDRVSGGTKFPKGQTHLFFTVPTINGALYGVYQKFVVPITTDKGDTPKKLSFVPYSYGPHPSVLSKFEVRIDNVWESDS
ncbi:phage tail protein [Vibrio splendidus]